MPETRHNGQVTAVGLGGAFTSQRTTTKRRRKKKRECRHVGCRTVLSQYNPNSKCSLHQEEFVKPTVVGRGD